LQELNKKWITHLVKNHFDEIDEDASILQNLKARMSKMTQNNIVRISLNGSLH
jgi:hypothetical protein